MKRALRLLTVFAVSAAFVMSAASQPPEGGKEGKGKKEGQGEKGKGPGGKAGPGGKGGKFELGRVLPPPARDALKLTPEQVTAIDALEKDVKEKLNKILTDEQKKALENIRPGGGPGGPGGDGGPGGEGGPPRGGDEKKRPERPPVE